MTPRPFPLCSFLFLGCRRGEGMRISTGSNIFGRATGASMANARTKGKSKYRGRGRKLLSRWCVEGGGDYYWILITHLQSEARMGTHEKEKGSASRGLYRAYPGRYSRRGYQAAARRKKDKDEDDETSKSRKVEVAFSYFSLFGCPEDDST